MIQAITGISSITNLLCMEGKDIGTLQNIQRIIRRFEKKNAHFEEKILIFEKRADFFPTIICSVYIQVGRLNDDKSSGWN